MYICILFSVTFYEFAELQIIGRMDLSKDSKSHRILPDSITEYHSARLARLPSNTNEIARFAPLLQVEIGSSSVFESSNFNLAPKSMRSPLPCHPDRTGTLIYLVSDRFITRTRVRVCIRMNKTRVVRLVGIDSGSRRSPLAKVESGVPPWKCARITLPENAEIESLRFSAVFRPLFLESLVKSIIVTCVNMLLLYLFSLRFSPGRAKAKLNSISLRWTYFSISWKIRSKLLE